MNVIDAFTFFNELDVLEWRLEELYPVVDKFILVEATHTHKGEPKALHYAANRQRYARWNDKVRHVVVGDLPRGDTQAAIWRREILQRQAIERGLDDIDGDTLILISDLDEIPRREYVGMLAEQGIDDDAIVTFEQTLFYYNANTTCQNIRWNGTRATHVSNARVLGADGVRWESLKQRSAEYPKQYRLPNAGWHLSYFGDVAHIQNKMRSFLHQELVSEANSDPDTIARRMAEGLDIWGRESEQRFTLGPAPDLPWSLRSDPQRWARYFHPDWRPTFHEDWYVGEQNAYLSWMARQYKTEPGAIIEIGCWEGKSTCCLAQTVAPHPLIAVDTWEGSPTEGEYHPTLDAIKSGRDVEATFTRNIELLTPGNVTAIKSDWREWAKTWDQPIAFLHLDAAHDYASVRDCLQALAPFVIPGGMIAGDDAYMQGVYDGTHEVLGDVMNVGGRLWIWQKGA